MNDEQMEALDEQLENVFRQRKMASSKKKERKDAKETIILFKCRVLELLEIYIKQEHLKMLAVELVIPLLGTIRKTTSKQVSEKACSVVREYSKAYRLKDQDAAGASTTAKDNDVALARSVLGAIHAEACRAGSNAHAAACSQARLLLAKITVSRGGQVADVILQYAETQRRFTTDPACAVRTAFFSDFLNWCTSVRKRGVAQ
jgi:DNA polymerase phi